MIIAAPRTLWRITQQDGSLMHGVLWQRRPKTAVVWYRDGEVQGVEEFDILYDARDSASALRQQATAMR